ncbi:hypothetical protein GTCCBUS3UF5_38530 [Geobacillus thermoleovorans CCB_US3_UF5]|uniref:Uncharacterized protein n=1 Tax=Geobacillus thermoleovorans CCB_US3_UF5 TaxID=1111068 RepID=A0ABN4A611_GEOTH|nr:hypothetical protein GTCCBUS3UF5_38530 [Geobacillus thermoleovorans CCB_US3_UF5]GAJ57099.1 hypothetical protein B23_0288 [Geobacillus thermoleovorans B23]
MQDAGTSLCFYFTIYAAEIRWFFEILTIKAVPFPDFFQSPASLFGKKADKKPGPHECPGVPVIKKRFFHPKRL